MRKSRARKSRKCKKSQFRSRKSGYCRKRKCGSGRTRDIVTRLCRNKKSRSSGRHTSRRRKSQLRNNYSPKKTEETNKKDNIPTKKTEGSITKNKKDKKIVEIDKGKKYTKEDLQKRMDEGLESNFMTITLGMDSSGRRGGQLNTDIYNEIHREPVSLVEKTLEDKFTSLKERFETFLSNPKNRLYRCVSSANLNYIYSKIQESKKNIDTLHPEKRNQKYSIKEWISRGSKKKFKGGQYSSTTVDFNLISQIGSKLCGKEKPSKDKKTMLATNVECLLSINISKLIRRFSKDHIRIIMPSTNEDEEEIVYTGIGTDIEIPNKSERPEYMYMEIPEDKVHVDIYPAFSPDLLLAWFGLLNPDNYIGISDQNTAFAAITAQEVIMSGNYPIDILEVVAYHKTEPLLGSNQMEFLPKPISIREYFNQRENIRAGGKVNYPVASTVQHPVASTRQRLDPGRFLNPKPTIKK